MTADGDLKREIDQKDSAMTDRRQDGETQKTRMIYRQTTG